MDCNCNNQYSNEGKGLDLRTENKSYKKGNLVKFYKNKAIYVFDGTDMPIESFLCMHGQCVFLCFLLFRFRGRYFLFDTLFLGWVL
jgi:hypothetical protein